MCTVFNLHLVVIRLHFLYVSAITCPSTPPYQKRISPIIRHLIFHHPLLYETSKLSTSNIVRSPKQLPFYYGPFHVSLHLSSWRSSVYRKHYTSLPYYLLILIGHQHHFGCALWGNDGSFWLSTRPWILKSLLYHNRIVAQIPSWCINASLHDHFNLTVPINAL